MMTVDSGLQFKCTSCNLNKTSDEFPFRNIKKNLKHSHCKQCKSLKEKIRLQNPEKREINLARTKAWKLKNPEKAHKIQITYRKKHRSAILKKCKEYRLKNPLKDKEYYAKTREKQIARSKKYRSDESYKKIRNIQLKAKYCNDPIFRLTVAIRTQLYRKVRLKSNGGFRHLQYTPSELKNSLESKFKLGMSWDNYGCKGWHIDHIIPIKYKNPDGSYYWNQEELANPLSETFKMAWGLDNLQPMWAMDNIKKRNKMIL